MTEAEWLASDDPERMLTFVNSAASLRKLRLFGVVCCRRIWELMPDVKCELAVDIAEGHANGHCDDEALQAAYERVASAIGTLALISESAEYAATAAAWVSSQDNLARTLEAAAAALAVHKTAGIGWAREWEFDKLAEHRHQTDILRDVFGNPFRPVVFDPVWRTDTAVALAQQMYEARDFSAMPILADALQDTGCDSAEILDHCRGPGPHVRGCWAVDLVLGKE
jgi:hypothetical protein